MHYTSLASFAVVGLALIAPLVSAHPANKTSKNPSYSTIKSTPKPKSYADAEPQAHSEFDSADCYRVSSPECDKAYDDSLAAFKAENPDYDFNAEPYADSKRNSNVCKCTGSLLHGGYKVISVHLTPHYLITRRFCLTRERAGPMQIRRRIWICTSCNPPAILTPTTLPTPPMYPLVPNFEN